MKRVNKYVYLWYIQGNYGPGLGWDDLAGYDTWKELRGDLKAYREAEPQYAHRVIRRREPNPEYQEPGNAQA